MGFRSDTVERNRRLVVLAGVVVVALAVGVTGTAAQDATATGEACKVVPTDYSLSDSSVAVGESIEITVTVENTCDREETTDVVPMKDGDHVKSKTKTVSVPAKSTITVTVNVSFSTAGDHTVSIFPLDSTPVTVTEGDSDGDGVSDGEDGCPTEAEDEDSVQDGDGCPDETIWTQDHLTEEQRNDECLQRALKLAQQIAMSEEATDAWGKVNKPNLSIEDELAPGEAPEINFTELGDDFGEYRGDSSGEENQIFVDKRLFENCGNSDEDFLSLVVTILHETAHWKDDVKKHDGGGAGDTQPEANDTDGEEGKQWEEDTFGTAYPENEAAEDVDHWVDPKTWTDDDKDASPPRLVGSTLTQSAPRRPATTAGTASSLSVSVEPTREEYPAGGPVRVEVTVTNTGTSTVDVLSSVAVEGYPFSFEITDSDGDRLAFLGPEIRPDVGPEDFVTLQPGENHTETVNLGRDPDRGTPRYGNVTSAGEYTVRAVYDGTEDQPVTSSGNATITVDSGMEGDHDGDGAVSTPELRRSIRNWARGDLPTEKLRQAIRNWATS